jgi:hypothetical protein
VLGLVLMGSGRPDGYGYGRSRHQPDQAVVEVLQSGDGM